VDLRLASGGQTVDDLLAEAVQGEKVGMLAVLIQRPELENRLGRLVEMAVQNGHAKTFKFLAGTVGEERLNQVLGKDGDLPALIVKSESTSMIDALAELGFDPNTRNAQGETIASLALKAGKIELFKYVVEAIRKQDLAAQAGHKKPRRNSLDAATPDVPPLLEVAIREERLEEVKFLLAHGASPNPVAEDLSGLGRIERMRRQKAGRPPFIELAIEAQNAAIVEALVETGAELTPPGVCLLEKAMCATDMSIVKLLARKMGQNAVNAARDSMGNTMLNRAILDNNVPMVEFFAAWPGANLNALNFKGVTPICEAANNQRPDIVELLARQGVALDAPIQPESRQTLLHNAVAKRDFNMAKWLIEHGIDINAVDARGKTALDLAVMSEDRQYIELLLDSDRTDINAGAIKPHERAALKVHRQPPLQLALGRMLAATGYEQMAHMAEVVLLLIDLGADVNAQDSNGATALHQMARELERMKAQWGARGQFAPLIRRVLKVLSKAGANPDLSDANGQRPADVARQAGAELKQFLGARTTNLFLLGPHQDQRPSKTRTGEHRTHHSPLPPAP